MELSIRTRSVELTDELRALVTKRIQLALDTFGDRIKNCSVYIMDLNGPKGGVDKVCQIDVQVQGIGELVVREPGSTVAAALTRATRRVKYRTAEALRESDLSSTESIRKTSAAA